MWIVSASLEVVKGNVITKLSSVLVNALYKTRVRMTSSIPCRSHLGNTSLRVLPMNLSARAVGSIV